MSAKVDFLFVLFMDCSEKLCVDRVLKRGQAGSGRSDDNVDSLKKRFNTYVSDTMPIIDHYQKLNQVVRIDTSPSPNEVFDAVDGALKKAKNENLF